MLALLGFKSHPNGASASANFFEQYKKALALACEKIPLIGGIVLCLIFVAIASYLSFFHESKLVEALQPSVLLRIGILGTLHCMSGLLLKQLQKYLEKSGSAAFEQFFESSVIEIQLEKLLNEALGTISYTINGLFGPFIINENNFSIIATPGPAMGHRVQAEITGDYDDN